MFVYFFQLKGKKTSLGYFMFEASLRRPKLLIFKRSSKIARLLSRELILYRKFNYWIYFNPEGKEYVIEFGRMSKKLLMIDRNVF